MWLSQEGPGAKKHRGWRHPVVVFMVHYSIVGFTTIAIHDRVINPQGVTYPNEALATTCNSSPHLGSRQRNVAFFLALYYVVYFAIRLFLARRTRGLVFCEFYRQTFLCSVTIANAAFCFATGRPTIAQAFCLAVGIDQLLWYVDLGWYFIRGSFPIGVTKYLFWPGTTWASRVTSTHHFWTVPLVMWASGGALEWRALPLSFIIVAINVLLSHWMTPHSIMFPKEDLGGNGDGHDCRGGLTKKDVLYLNLNLAHELWTDLHIGFLLIGEGKIPYLIRLLVWWSFCNSLVFSFLYCVTYLFFGWRHDC